VYEAAKASGNDPELIFRLLVKNSGTSLGGKYVPGIENLISRLNTANNQSNIRSVVLELTHARNMRAFGAEITEFGDSANPFKVIDANGQTIVADVDVFSVKNGIKYYDDSKGFTLKALPASLQDQASRLKKVADLSGAKARWVFPTGATLDLSALQYLRSIGVDAVESTTGKILNP